MTDENPTYRRLIALLDEHRAEYRLIDHASEGRTELVSAMRGHDPAHAAKCILVMLKFGKKVTRFLLAVILGDARLNVEAVKSLKRATYAGFAPPEKAEQLTACVVGTVLPFALDPTLELLADVGIREADTLFFNAARLDRSVALRTDDYIRIANPRFEHIAERQPSAKVL